MPHLALLVLALIAFRLVSLLFVTQPGYTDAYYYANVAGSLARGEGLTADFLWSPLESRAPGELPVPSHRFWMPLASVLGAAGLWVLGPLLGDFRATQLPFVALAALLPLAAYAAARRLDATRGTALVAAALAGLGGAFAPAWVSVDSFVPAALIGTAFFLAYGRAASGDVLAATLAGALVGALHLARSEGALFGIALLALLVPRASRTAGLAGTLVALAIGLSWQARNVALGIPDDLLARTALLVRYEDFFAIRSPEPAAFFDALPEMLGAKLSALATNAATISFALLFVLVPALAAGIRSRWARPEVRAFAGLLVLVYLTTSLVWTPHSIRGLAFHSLASFFVLAVALAAVGGAHVLRPGTARAAASATVAASLVVSLFALGEWSDSFDGAYRARLAALPEIPGGPFLAVDAAAWRWISGRPVIVTPADGPLAAACLAADHGARSLVLEPVHFSAYGALYGGETDPLLRRAGGSGAIRVYAITADLDCERAP